MNRSEKEINDPTEILSIIQAAKVCRIGLSNGIESYIVPLSFGFYDNTIYFHSAHKGRKIDMIRENPIACFEIDIDAEIVEGATPCEWGMAFRSVIGQGRIEEITDQEAKRFALNIIMNHYTTSCTPIRDKPIKATAVFALKIGQMTGKISGF